MITQERTKKKITRFQRRMMRRIPLSLLKEAYERLMAGRKEENICIFLGVNEELFKSVLKQAVAEALWERGCLMRRE